MRERERERGGKERRKWGGRRRESTHTPGQLVGVMLNETPGIG